MFDFLTVERGENEATIAPAVCRALRELRSRGTFKVVSIVPTMLSCFLEHGVERYEVTRVHLFYTLN